MKEECVHCQENCICMNCANNNSKECTDADGPQCRIVGCDDFEV